MAGHAGYWNDGMYYGPNLEGVAKAGARLSNGKRSLEVFGDVVFTARKADELSKPDTGNPNPGYRDTPLFILAGWGGLDRSDPRALQRNPKTLVYTAKGSFGQIGRGETHQEAIDEVNRKALARLRKLADRRAA